MGDDPMNLLRELATLEPSPDRAEEILRESLAEYATTRGHLGSRALHAALPVAVFGVAAVYLSWALSAASSLCR